MPQPIDIDADALGRWLDDHAAPGQGERPVLELLTGGSQNTLYRVRRCENRMVLRMPGARADAARLDGLLREIRLVRALSGTDVPHARFIAADDAGTVLGKPFYVMAEIDGWSPMNGAGRRRSTPTSTPAPGWRSSSSRARPSSAASTGAPRASTASAGRTVSTSARSTAG